MTEFEKAGRVDLAAKERAEREILLAYLPQQKSAEEIREIVARVLSELAPDSRNQGSVMKLVMPALKGLADGNLVREVVLDELRSSGAK